MRVRCSGEYPSGEALELLGPDYHRKQAFAISLGNEYLVLGMFFARGPTFGIGPWIQFKDDEGQYGQAPLALFEIIDPRVPRFWEVRDRENGNVDLGPPSFHRDFYMEDFYEGVPEIVEDFERVCRLMESEFDWLRHKHPLNRPYSLDEARRIWNKLQDLGFNPQRHPGHAGRKWKAPHIQGKVGGAVVHIPVDRNFWP